MCYTISRGFGSAVSTSNSVPEAGTGHWHGTASGGMVFIRAGLSLYVTVDEQYSFFADMNSQAVIHSGPGHASAQPLAPAILR